MSLAAPAANLAKDYSCVESSSDPDVWPAPLPKLVGWGNGDKVWGVCGVGTFRGLLAKDYSCVESSSDPDVWPAPLPRLVGSWGGGAGTRYGACVVWGASEVYWKRITAA